MKNITVSFFILATVSFAQAQSAVIFQKKYSELPIPIRIENCGIYGIASFDVFDDGISLDAFDAPQTYIYKNNSSHYRVINTKHKAYLNDFADEIPTVTERAQSQRDDPKTILTKSYFGAASLYADDGGIMTNRKGEKIIVNAVSRDELKIEFRAANEKTFELNFPHNLACAEIIGIDQNGNTFLLIETYRPNAQLRVDRWVFVVSPQGNELSRLAIPDIKYLYTTKDFQIDRAGNLYHLLTERESVSIIKWSGLTQQHSEILQYPARYKYSLHYNDLIPTTEAPSEHGTGVELAAGRNTALRLGEQYVYLKYSCSAANLSPANVRAPDGDTVRTPSWLIVGANATVPYRWGGFNTITEFYNGLAAGKYAGDIHTAGVSSYAVGVDCSGFVSRCWQLTYHSSTADMPGITTQYAAWDSLRPGDAVHKVGHVRLFVERNTNGTLRIVESSGRNWNVSYWTYAISDLSSYTPRYYNNMELNYSAQRPVMTSALFESPGNVKFNWTCDTTGVKGYRLYRSTNGATWNIILNENTLTTTTATIMITAPPEYYRVSSVLNNGSAAESNWSNVLAASIALSNNRILIVDGFERSEGSWRGAGHAFVMRYGSALKGNTFESAKNSLIISGQVDLANYDIVYWILGDESTINETFSAVEQTKVKTYLEGGGKLFVSGSEIGWDLFNSGSTSDKAFFTNYLKAGYVSDDAGVSVAAGIAGGVFSGVVMNFGQTYEEDYPDEIAATGGSSLCMRYSNNKGAGIAYTGLFGSSADTGAVIYFAYPLETTANDTAFNLTISRAQQYFVNNGVMDVKDNTVVRSFILEQNYPNPFNPTTIISYQIPKNGLVTLIVYDALGRAVQTLVNEEKAPGEYSVEFNASNFPSGIYFYTLRSGDFSATRKLLLLK